MKWSDFTLLLARLWVTSIVSFIVGTISGDLAGSMVIPFFFALYVVPAGPLTVVVLMAVERLLDGQLSKWLAYYGILLGAFVLALGTTVLYPPREGKLFSQLIVVDWFFCGALTGLVLSRTPSRAFVIAMSLLGCVWLAMYTVVGPETIEGWFQRTS